MPHDEVIAPEAAIDEAACLQELSDIKDNHGPYSPEALSCLSKLCDFYKRAGEIATLESVLQQILKHDERTAGCFHSDTIATSLSLTNVYIQRGKSTEALSLLHRLVESSLKLGVDSESETRAVYKTENDATKLTVLQLGFEMGKRNYHNGAVDVLERAFGHFSTALGDCHADTVAVGNLLSLSYVQQFVQPPLREDRPRHHCIVKLAQLCERIFEVDRSPIWTLGLMCLRSNDRTNASFAFRQAPGSASCDVCKEIIKPSTQWLACKPCLLVSVCNNCYLKWTTRTNQDEPITPTCAGHQFYIVEAENLEQASTGSIDNEDPVRAWLRKLIEQKTQLATTVAFLDHWECLGKPEELLEFRNPVYFLESDSLPALVDEMRATSSPVQRLEWYKSWLTHSVPILQDLFFGSKGFSNEELPQWKLDEAASEAKLQTALVEHAHAVLHVAGIPTAPVLEVDTPRAESEPAIGKLYQKYQITTSGNTIRLLTLVPGEGSILKATMSCADLSSSPTYEALSYVWGTMENCSEHFLHIDDTILEITPNLYRALHALRSRQSPRVLWVDAVCINQNDNRDKETQICLMEDIYKKANHVVVYLGEPADISAHLLSFLDRDVPEDHSAVEALTHLGHNDMRQLLEAFIHFCQLPWWNRIWVQQEYLLAQTHPTFCLGHSSFHVSALLRDWGILQRELALNILPFAGDVNLELNLQMMSWQPIMRQVLHVHGVLTLRSALGRSEYPYLWLPRGVLKKVNLRCTNPRDRIYGMRSNLDPVARAFFTPNYTESVEVAFHRLAAWLLAIDQWQQVFWWYPHRLSPNLPSWVPDFTRPLPEAAFSERNLFDYGKLKKSSPCPLAIRDGILAMEGYLLDTVSHVYAIDQPDWPSTVRELWFLESIFADLPSSTMLRKAPPIFNTLPGLHTRDPLQNWMSPTIKSAKRSIVFELSPFNCFEKDDILKSVFDPFLNGIKDIAKLHTDIIESLVAQLRELSSEVTRSNLQARIPINLQIHEHLQVVSAFTEIRLRLSTLSLFLQRSNHTATDLFGAALFDYPNLLDQILHLRKPSLPCHFPASQISTISARLRTVNGPSNDNTSPPDWIPHNPSGLIARVQPIYEILQHQITACVFPEEVTMRARLILAYATAIRTFPTTFSTNPKPTSTTSYHHLRDQRIQSTTTLIQTLAEDNAAQEALNQLILAESHTYFSALATQFPDDADVAATLAQYHSVLAESKVSSATLKETIETQSKKLEEAMLDIRTNTMYHHNAQAFERDAFEISTSLSNRTFFSTEYGLVGVGCQGVRDVRVGDKLVVLRGTEFPMVVREVEEGMHEIVGYSIVRGFGYEDFEKLGRFEKPVRQAFYFR